MLRLRIGTGLAAAAVLGAGLFLSGKLARDSRARVAELAATAPSSAGLRAELESAARAAAFDEVAFVEGAEADARAMGLDVSKASHLSGAQRHVVELDEPVVLAAGKRWRSPHLEIRAVVQRVAYQKLGATVSARHSIARVKNLGASPVAYLARVRSHDRGQCEVRGVRTHNAMALMPKEVAEMVICAGAGKIRIDRVEVLEISELGYRYVSRVPPQAAGHDGVSATAHVPGLGDPVCETVDTIGLSRAIRAGVSRWVDVVDYYSRHACDRYRFFDGYRHQARAPARLPIRPPEP